MEKYTSPDKRMTLKEAVDKFVHDGDSFVIANCLTSMPLATVHEMIRSGKKGMTIFQQGGIEELDQLVEAGTVNRAVLSYNFRSGGKRIQTPLDRAVKEGRVQLDEVSNFALCMMMKAGAMGYSFLPILSGLRETDVVKQKGFLGDQKFGEVIDPFTGKSTLAVKGYNPEFAICHVQRADKAGNGQLWGAFINSKWAALAAKKVILTTEKIVDSSVVKSSPHLTIVPGHKVCAVIEVPWGAHPCEMIGYYDYDMLFRMFYLAGNGTAAGMKGWMDEWIYNMPDRESYIKHYIDKYGEDTLDSFKAKQALSVPADYGFTFTHEWNEKGYSSKLGMTIEQFDQYLADKGILIES